MKMQSLQQRGFTLIKVMLLSSVASVVVFAAFKDTLVQERLSGNYQKDLNARLLAEKGVIERGQALKAAITNNANLTLEQAVQQIGAGLGTGELDGTSYNAQLSVNGDEVSIASLGQRYDDQAHARMVSYFKYTPAERSSVFQNAVTGCKGVNLAGSGLVDSYDSTVGSYEDTRTSNGDVNTVIGDADVVLNGHSPIMGDVKASGVLYLKGSSPVVGTVQSNTGIDISAGSGVRVDGDVLTQGYVKHNGGQITGVLRANGDVSMKWGAEILNQNQAELDIMYGGTGSFQSSHVQDGLHYSADRFNVNPEVEAVRVYDPSSPDYDPNDPDKECDPLALPLNMPSVIDSNNTYTDFTVGAQTDYVFTPSEGRYIRGGSDTWSSSPADIYLFQHLTQNHGQSNTSSEYVFGMKNMKLTSDGTITIEGGDVIWLVDGDFKMTGHTSITIKAGSSLAIFVTGKVDFGASGVVITEQEGLTNSGFPSLSIFSSYSGQNGITMRGASSMYAVIYAPVTSIAMRGSGQFYGTIRGATIDATGGSGVHFDEALKNFNLGNGGVITPAKLEFMGWRFESGEDYQAPDEDEE
ncbi:PulJ/GspJ family protein [Pseudoalteromonas sp. PPB1]|uniref:PulJ/GspJ family protein n=1 Tax=Pseudoalteromonas sp. PPB1 TaxID=2756136 RepID=UPI00189124F6|nr:polymer-forming cytoskeletal protein [Pseudoalteromonas sp. PPB1]